MEIIIFQTVLETVWFELDAKLRLTIIYKYCYSFFKQIRIIKNCMLK